MAFGFGYGGNVLGIRTDIVSAGVGGLFGAVQTFALREYLDTPMAKTFLTAGTSGTPPFLMKALGNFGSPSALIGIGAGIVGLAVGYLMLRRGSQVAIGSFALSYGLVALSTGILSGFLPTASWSSAVAVDPSNPVRIAGRRGVTIRPGGAVAAAPVTNVQGVGTI